MLWPIALPFKITFWILAALVALFTGASPAFRWPRGKTFFLSSLFASVAFVPSCAAVMLAIDSQRFGIFHYDGCEEVRDFRVERYLPPSARSITVDKSAMGHRAKYSISEADLRMYIDRCWATGGEYSAIDRDELHDGVTADYKDVRYKFDGLGWPPLGPSIPFFSPIQGDGGGASYYFDPQTSTAYHRAAYW